MFVYLATACASSHKRSSQVTPKDKWDERNVTNNKITSMQ